MKPLVDLADVQQLLAIVERHGLQSLTVSEGGSEVQIIAQPGTRLVAMPAAGQAPPASTEDAVAPLLDESLRLRSPITGVFYRSASPSEPPFVQVGDVIEAEDPVCLIEAMKIFNEIPAGLHGRVARIVAANEQLVVVGDVLIEFESLEDA